MGVSDEIHVPVALALKMVRPSLLDVTVSETKAAMDEVSKIEPW
jgi:hypothetical protein